MPKRTSKKQFDINTLATEIIEAATNPPKSDSEKNPAAVALGRLGGQKGGPARAAKLSPRKRSQIAAKAAKARWGKKK